MNILVANDDGIKSEGLIRLVEALSSVGDVYVAAPEGQRSASGHGITIAGCVTIKDDEVPMAVKAVKLSGTPADCVKLGLKKYEKMGINIDVVCAGINHGGNLGTDTLYSGTVAAALEGVLCGKPAIAVSVNSHNPEYFDYPCKLAKQAVLKIWENRVDEADRERGGDVALNINVPNKPESEILGVCYTRLGLREYEEFIRSEDSGEGVSSYRYDGHPFIYASKNLTIDVLADQEGYASITPLRCDLTDHKNLKIVEKWGIENVR